ncbi:hypothetical protein SEHO0A_01720 [Salmonella enterica subsp. houtenae str. ATCC BAA-1581]|nr:hypothetical protein SEHO0A_01720 [Salmonella enterica subsp. houtenae str. ATCC BAA-1581]ENZ86761.1 hypothetical protein D088_690026 [Salmonella enterica subsp. houtenae serovar 16:z4,z32:-- str. RKS3027]
MVYLSQPLPSEQQGRQIFAWREYVKIDLNPYNQNFQCNF